MGKEIERKFLLSKLPNLKWENIQLIKQNYLMFNEISELRIREEIGEEFKNKYTLTYKSGGGNLVREENEIEIDKNTYLDLLGKYNSIPIVKTRYQIHIDSKEVIVDVYDDVLNKLVISEIEFKNEDEANSFIPFDWMGKEVTYDKTYKNKNLWKSIQNK